MRIIIIKNLCKSLFTSKKNRVNRQNHYGKTNQQEHEQQGQLWKPLRIPFYKQGRAEHTRPPSCSPSLSGFSDQWYIWSNSCFYNWSLKKWSIIMTDHILPLLSWELFNALLKPAGKTIPGDHQTNDICPQLMICLHFSFLLFVVNLLFLETDCDLAWKYFRV